MIKKQIEPENENLTVYPNPAVSNVYLRSNVLKYSLEIFDTTGKLILSIVEFSDNNTLNLEDLKPGTYIARITSGKNMKTARFVKN
ncbi:MAG: T9SS type A sorting domain-containing protein [Bacteroidetes bacterium]|nr:T9SS type A sorting domain-containing protein [Bacteroidota bacterium]